MADVVPGPYRYVYGTGLMVYEEPDPFAEVLGSLEPGHRVKVLSDDVTDASYLFMGEPRVNHYVKIQFGLRTGWVTWGFHGILDNEWVEHFRPDATAQCLGPVVRFRATLEVELADGRVVTCVPSGSFGERPTPGPVTVEKHSPEAPTRYERVDDDVTQGRQEETRPCPDGDAAVAHGDMRVNEPEIAADPSIRAQWTTLEEF